MTLTEFLQTGTWRAFQRKAQHLGRQPGDLLAGLVEAFLASEGKADTALRDNTNSK
jgi:hypothetical protein